MNTGIDFCVMITFKYIHRTVNVYFNKSTERGHTPNKLLKARKGKLNSWSKQTYNEKSPKLTFK